MISKAKQHLETARPARWMAGSEIEELEHASGGDKALARCLMDVLHGMLIDEGKRYSASKVVCSVKNLLSFCVK